MLSASGMPRSVEASCDTFESETDRLAEKYETRSAGLQQQGDALVGLLGTFGSAVEGLGDAVLLYGRLEAVAPSDIQPEVAAVRDAPQGRVDALGRTATDPHWQR